MAPYLHIWGNGKVKTVGRKGQPRSFIEKQEEVWQADSAPQKEPTNVPEEVPEREE